MIDLLDGSAADPRKPQRRLATTPSGRQVWVEITGDDRLSLIRQLPSRWPEVLRARERGESLEQIHRWARAELPPERGPGACQGNCEPACLRCGLAAAYAWLETELHDLAARRARLMV